MPILQTEALSKTYQTGLLKRREVRALKDVSLNVNAGELFGLLGPNGAGKTTFVKIILSLVLPTGGYARLFDKDVRIPSTRERIGYLPENHRYPSFLTALETLSLFGNLHGMRGQALRDRARSLLELVGLKDWMHVKTKRFSKGMLQRLGLAQTLLNDPEVLFLDEPTDGVDPLGRKEIRDLLRSLKNEGRTIFVNSHFLSEVEMISDRVAILNNGQILKTGSITEMTTHHLEYEITVEGSVSHATLAAIQSVAQRVAVEGNRLTVALEEKAAINRIIDTLRRDSVVISSLVPRKSSLEEYFIEVIRKEDAR